MNHYPTSQWETSGQHVRLQVIKLPLLAPHVPRDAAWAITKIHENISFHAFIQIFMW